MALDLQATFEKFDDEFSAFRLVENKRSRRPDMHAFLLLDEILPPEGNTDMICSAEHDEIWLDVDCEKLAAAATEDQICELVRCGIMYDEEVDSLAMFV